MAGGGARRFEGGELDQLPALVTGDFNSAAHDSGAYSTLVTDGPTLDTWDAAQKQLTPAWGTFPAYKEPVDGGERIDCQLAFFSIAHHPLTGLGDQLGCERDKDGYLVVDADGRGLHDRLTDTAVVRN